MKTESRKSFLQKACLAGMCMCGFSTMASAGSSSENQNENKTEQLVQNWIALLLDSLESVESPELCRQLIRNSAKAHYAHLNMDQFLDPFIGQLNNFILFIEKEWGWKIDYRKESGILLADENKNVCVCPILNPDLAGKSSALCYCSEGFAELMFSKVCQKDVSARVISSIHRGNEHCIYEIRI